MSRASELVSLLIERGLHIAVAESLTGGMLVSELIDIPGASATVVGGVVAYDTEIKQTLLQVDASVLNVHGAVHPDVAAQMASHVRSVLSQGGLAADVGVSTTGVAGPDDQDGHPPGTVHIGVSIDGDVRVSSLQLQGDRASIRRQTVDVAIDTVIQRLTAPDDTAPDGRDMPRE